MTFSPSMSRALKMTGMPLYMRLMAFAKGMAPMISVEFARRAIPHDVRPSFKDMESACKGGAAFAGRCGTVIWKLGTLAPGTAGAQVQAGPPGPYVIDLRGAMAGVPTAGEFSPDGEVFWVGYDDGTIKRHELETGRILTKTYGAIHPIMRAALTPGPNPSLWTAFKEAGLFSMNAGNSLWPVGSLNSKEDLVDVYDQPEFSPDGRFALVRNNSGQCGLYNARITPATPQRILGEDMGASVGHATRSATTERGRKESKTPNAERPTPNAQERVSGADLGSSAMGVRRSALGLGNKKAGRLGPA